MKGTVFNVQRYSVHDGPGIRTIIFLKGCPLRCQWCSNPESQLLSPQIAYKIDNCIGSKCQRCIEVCPNQNISLKDKDIDKVEIDFTNCTQCLKCSKACPAKAIITYGENKEIDDLLEQVEADQLFYTRSGGGLTVSGGEPLMQHEFVLALLKEAKRRRIHTAIETCGYGSWEKTKEIFAYLDYILFDIKSLNSQKHKKYTGQGNEMILDTFMNMKKAYPEKPVRVRTPIIPGFNDTDEDILGIYNWLTQFENVEYELLQYHRFGAQKYKYIGKTYELGEAELSQERFMHFKNLISTL